MQFISRKSTYLIFLKNLNHFVSFRAIEIYHSFDISISAPLLKDTYTQKAGMHIQQSDLEHAKSCYEHIMRLFMEVKFDDYESIAQVRTEYGRLMVQCGESGEAALLFQQSIDVYRRRSNKERRSIAEKDAAGGDGDAATPQSKAASARKRAQEEEAAWLNIHVAENLLERGAAWPCAISAWSPTALFWWTRAAA